MAKANKKAIEGGNFWDMRVVHGRLAGKPKVDADETKVRHQKKKDRLRKERYMLNLYSNKGVWNRIHLRTYLTKHKIKEIQIQYGFDLAKWWMLQHA